jgi:hypothetical protein
MKMLAFLKSLTSRMRRPSTPTQRVANHPEFECLENRVVPTITLGGQFPVNVPTSLTTFTVRSAASDNGRFVVAWAQTPRTASPNPSYLRAQLFSASGQRLGGEILVTGGPINYNDGLDVAMARNGNFVVAWSQRDPNDPSNVYARRFASNGALLGGTIIVANRAGAETNPHVAMDAAGNFVVTFQASGDLYGVRYLSTGEAYRPFIVYASSSLSVLDSDIAMAADGRFSISYVVTGAGSSLIVKNYSRLALLRVTETIFSRLAFGVHTQIAVDDRANAVVAWDNYSNLGNLLVAQRIFAVRVNSTGGRTGGIVITNASSKLLQSVSVDRTGNTFVVAWGSQNDGTAITSRDLILTEVTASNVPSGPYVVDAGNTSVQHLLVSLATRSRGTFVLAFLLSSNSFDADVFARLGNY